MTTATSFWTQTRRRWLIFVLAFSGVGLVVWRQLSEGDSRFVGTWRIAGSERSADATITLNANGLGHWPRTLSGDLEHFPWIARDGRLVLGWSARSADWWLGRRVLSQLLDRQDYPGTMDLEIITVTPTHIILRDASNSLDVVLTRVSD